MVDTSKVQFPELMVLLVNDYKINEKRSIGRTRSAVQKLYAFFGDCRVQEITTSRTGAYVIFRKASTTRLGGPPANATINYELSLLKRMFSLAHKADPPKCNRIPHIPKLDVDNARTGFLDDEQYRNLRANLPDYLKPVLAAGYYTGRRLKELLTLKWSQVDLEDGVIVLYPQDTKNREGARIPMTKELWSELHAQKKYRDENFPSREWVFYHRKILHGRGPAGRPIKDFYGAWRRACKVSGLEGLFFHDLRRSAARNWKRAGISDLVIMKIMGWKTRAIFDRYNITDDADLEEARDRMDAFHVRKGPRESAVNREKRSQFKHNLE